MAQPERALEMLRASPCTLEDLRPLANSRKATITMIYRLREAGHDIETISAKSAKGKTTYRLKREANSLRDHTYEEHLQ